MAAPDTPLQAEHVDAAEYGSVGMVTRPWLLSNKENNWQTATNRWVKGVDQTSCCSPQTFWIHLNCKSLHCIQFGLKWKQGEMKQHANVFRAVDSSRFKRWAFGWYLHCPFLLMETSEKKAGWLFNRSSSNNESNEGMNEWVTEWTNERMNERMSEWMN